MNADDRRHRLPFVEARLRMRSTDDGGRRAPMNGRLYPTWLVPAPAEEGGRMLASSGVEVIGADELAPGREGTVRVYPFAPQPWRHVEVGTEIEMTEGPSRVVGRGTVTEVRLDGASEDL